MRHLSAAVLAGSRKKGKLEVLQGFVLAPSEISDG